MSRPWNIAEQVVVEQNSKFRFEFTSEHTKAVAAGEEPPYHDKAVVLNIYNESGNRVIRMDFTRGEMFVGSDLMNVEPGETIPLTEQEEISKLMLLQEPVQVADGPVDELPQKTAEQLVAEIKASPAWEGETTQQEAWAGINVAKQFTGDID